MGKLPLPLADDALACALGLAGTPTPTPAALSAALAEMYPAGEAPTSPDELLAAGRLVPCISDRGRLRLPPLDPGEASRRLAGGEADSRNKNGIEAGFPDTLNGADSRNETGIESEFLEAFKKADSREIAGIETNDPTLEGKTNNRPRTGGQAPEGGTEAATETAPSVGPLFSYYRAPITNTVPHAAITLGQLHRVLLNPPRPLRERADAARAEYAAHGKSPAYRALKNGLDYFTAGGTFAPTRADAHLAAGSGLLTLDFDELGGGVAEARAALLADAALAPALALVFVSPSGDGLKAVLAADPRHSRQINYERLARHLTKRYGWGPTLDKKTADVSRACFLSHDPAAWLAPAYALAA